MMKLYVFNETSPKPSEWESGGRVLVLAKDFEEAKKMGD